MHLCVVAGEVRGAAWGPGASWAIDRVPALFGAGDDVTGFEPQHPVISSTWRRLRHLRLGATETVFELLVPSVLEQRVTGVEAHRSWRELLWRFGEPAPGPAPAGMRVVPTPELWSRIPSWEWHRANVDPGRARTIRSAAAVAKRLEEAVTLPIGDRLRRLRGGPGLGGWGAAGGGERAWGGPGAGAGGGFPLPALGGGGVGGGPGADDEKVGVLACYARPPPPAVPPIQASGGRKP